MISAIGLKFGGMMHSMMKQIAIQNGYYAGPIFVCSMGLWNFYTSLAPGPRDDITTPTI